MQMESIPDDIIVNIASCVGSSSVADLYNFKQCCKNVYEMCGDNLVFKQVSMEKLPTIPWFPLSQQEISFLKRCQEVQNTEVVYRLAMVEYFNKENIELGLAFLEKAADLGHVEATYVLGIIFICMDNQDSRMQGIELLKRVESCRKRSRFLGFAECRDKCNVILSQMWIKRCIRLQAPLCTKSSCKKDVRIFMDDYNDEEYSCEACICERDVELFCQLL